MTAPESKLRPLLLFGLASLLTANQLVPCDGRTVVTGGGVVITMLLWILLIATLVMRATRPDKTIRFGRTEWMLLVFLGVQAASAVVMIATQLPAPQPTSPAHMAPCGSPCLKHQSGGRRSLWIHRMGESRH